MGVFGGPPIDWRVPRDLADIARAAPPRRAPAAIGWAAEREIGADDAGLSQADIDMIRHAVAVFVAHERAAIGGGGARLRGAAIARVWRAITIAVAGARQWAAGALLRLEAGDSGAGVGIVAQAVAIAVGARPPLGYRTRAQIGKTLVTGLRHAAIG